MKITLADAVVGPNSLAPVFKLNRDVLHAIFRQVIHCSMREPAAWQHAYGYVAVSHVCQHWRDVMLESPTLWTDIIFSDPQMAIECIRRSKSAPLCVWITPLSQASQSPQTNPEGY